MPKFRKKPVVIEARQYKPKAKSIDLEDPNDVPSLIDWIMDNDGSARYECLIDFRGKPRCKEGREAHLFIIHTLEGEHKADEGDWIIKGVAGEFYPCKPEIFEQTYTPADEDDSGELSDGYHTFNELYRYRLLYNALWFNRIRNTTLDPVKSWKHSDGEDCFGGGWFVVTVTLPTGQVTNHYPGQDWDLFHIPEVPKAPEWDGHTPAEALERMQAYIDSLANLGEV